MKWQNLALVAALDVALVMSGGSTGCSSAGNKAPVLVGQAGLGVAQAIGQISQTTIKLQQASVLPAATALRMQEALLALNTALKPLPDILRTIDAAQQAGNVDASSVDKAVAILTAVSGDLAVLLAGVPVSETTTALIDLVRAGQTTIATVLVQIGQLKG